MISALASPLSIIHLDVNPLTTDRIQFIGSMGYGNRQLGERIIFFLSQNGRERELGGVLMEKEGKRGGGGEEGEGRGEGGREGGKRTRGTKETSP